MNFKTFALAISVLLTACSARVDDASGGTKCIEGMSTACACTNGHVGAQVCNASGSYDECVCEGSGPSPRVCAPVTGTTGCNKVDFLFVVDNSLSMQGFQANLAENFGDMFQSIRERLVGVSDYHMMVVDTDAYGYESSLCERICSLYASPGETLAVGDGTPDANAACNGYVCASYADASTCDTTLGAGVIHPIGGFASNHDCGLPNSQRWFDSSAPNFNDLASCTVRVGSTGNGDEKILGALTAALDPNSAAAACNTGFLRDDALLVVVFVSDAGPKFSMEQATNFATYRQLLVDAKCGREENIVLIGFIAQTEHAIANGVEDSCLGGFAYTGVARQYMQFIDSFGEHGFRADVCSEDYATAFAPALETIATGCSETLY